MENYNNNTRKRTSCASRHDLCKLTHMVHEGCCAGVSEFQCDIMRQRLVPPLFRLMKTNVIGGNFIIAASGDLLTFSIDSTTHLQFLMSLSMS